MREPDSPDEVVANRGGQESSGYRLSSNLSSERGWGRDLDQDVAGSSAIEMRPAHIAVTLNLSGSKTCRGQFVVLAAHRSRVVEVKADMKSFRIADWIVLLRLHQGEDEILVVVEDCERAGAAFEDAVEGEEPFEEGGKTRYVGSGEIEMLQLHDFHPSRF